MIKSAKCLYIVPVELKNKPMTGGEVSYKRIKKILDQTFGTDNVDVFVINQKNTKHVQRIRDVLNLNVWGCSGDKIKEITRYLHNNPGCRYVFLGASFLGKVLRYIYRENKDIYMGVFYQNVEYQYFMEYAKNKGQSKIILAYLARYNEVIAARYANVSIVLNKRDEELLKRTYKVRGNIVQIPIGMSDQFKMSELDNTPSNGLIKLLFVGSDFFPTYQGLKWFISKVLPFIEAELWVVGKGLEKYRSEFINDKVKMFGTVKSIDKYYYHCDLVVEPIFSGGGMKTKTAEALMYGKNIFGTQEAFEGYTLPVGICAECFNNDKEFISLFNKWKEEGKFKKFCKESRDIFVQKYEQNKLNILFYNQIFSK